jgi:hypothetical protein
MAFGKWHKYKKGLRKMVMSFKDRPPIMNSFKREALSKFVRKGLPTRKMKPV